MLPQDLARCRVPGRPAIAADGAIILAVSSPDPVADLYRGTLLRYDQGAERALTLGPRDSEPVTDPAGRLVVFRRAPEVGSPQLFSLRLDGGEPVRLTDHPRGGGPVVFSPDGRLIAYQAAVPEPGRYGTDELITADAEPPRRITRLSYRSDGEGFVLDKPVQIFVCDPTGSAPPVQVTDEPSGATDPAFTPDGRLLYVRATGVDQLTEEIAAIDVPATLNGASPGAAPADAPLPAAGQTLVSTAGSAALPVLVGTEIVYLGVAFDGVDLVGRTTGLWSAPLSGGPPRRLTDAATVDVDGAAGRPEPLGDGVLVGVLDRGSTALCRVPLDADQVSLGELPVIIGGNRVVRSFAVRGDLVAASVADARGPGEVVTVRTGTPAPAWPADGDEGPGEVRCTELNRELTAAGITAPVELTGTAPDGYPVHGWLVLPGGPGPHPVLLVIHGGPHSAYTPAFFDEAQVYSSAGYAVVMGNPRGSAGYGEAHGRAVVGALGTVDADDLLSLLDAALDRDDCDGDRVGVMGGSYGGFMTSWLCSHAPGRFVAAISERAVNAWDSFAGSSDIGYFFAAAYVGADRDDQWRVSPLAYADQMNVPLLVIHSEQDWRCPIEQGQRLFVALKSRGATTELLLFPGEGHELSRSGRPRHRVQRFEAILEWWRRYLPVEKPAGGTAGVQTAGVQTAEV